jgi:hypothetical protein
VRLLAAALVAIAGAAWATGAAAQDGRPVVVLVRPATSSPVIDEMLGRTRAELAASVFDARIVDGAPGEAPREAVEKADADAIAAIAVVDPAGEASLEIWVDDRLSGKVSIRPLEASRTDQHKAAAVLSIQAVELLRASLVEIARPEAAASPASSPAPRPAPPPAALAFARGPDRAAAKRRAELSLTAGPAAFVGFDPASIQIAPSLGLALTAPSGIGGRVRWTGPGLGPDLDVDEGRVSLSPWLLTAGAVLAPRTIGRWFGFATADAGVTRLTAEGVLAPPATGRDGSSLAAAFLAGGGAGLRLTDQVALVAEGQLLLTAPRITVEVGGERVASVGRPSAVVSVGLSLSR